MNLEVLPVPSGDAVQAVLPALGRDRKSVV